MYSAPSSTRLNFDAEFQRKIVKLALLDDGFCTAAIQHVRPEMFESDALRWCWQSILRERSDSRTPTPLVLRDKLRSVEPVLQPRYAAMLQAIETETIREEAYIRHGLAEFVARNVFVAAYQDSQKLYNMGKVVEAIDVMKRESDRAARISFASPARYWFYAELEDRQRQRKERARREYDYTFPTGIVGVDEVLDGGLSLGELGCWMGDAKAGKCHAKDQGILMWDGSIKNVQDVVIGDRVRGPTGPRRVLTTNRGRGELFDICPSRGEAPWRVNADHILTLVGGGSGAGSRYAGQVIDVPLREWQQWSGQKKIAFKLWRSEVREFGGGARLQDLPLDPYFLGVLLGDGSIKYNGIGVTTPDPEIVAVLHEQAVKYGLHVHVGTNDASKTAPYYGLSGTKGSENPIAKLLSTLGLRHTGSGEKFIPPAYKTAEWSVRLSILAGLLDTDGHLMKSSGTGYEFCSKSERLARDVWFVARSLGFGARLRSMRKSCQTGAVGTYYRVTLHGNVGEIPCRVERKKAKRQTAASRESRIHRDPQKIGFTVKPAGEGDYYGFSLDGDSRYLLDDFTVTHNSIMLVHLACYAARALMRKVLLVLLEGSYLQTASRMDAWHAAELYNEVKRGTFTYEAFHRLQEEYKGASDRLVIRQMTDSWSYSAADIRTELTELSGNLGWRPEMLVVDYGDLLRSQTGKAMSEEQHQRDAFGDLQVLCKQDTGYATWTVSQARRPRGLGKSAKDAGDNGTGEGGEVWRGGKPVLSRGSMSDSYNKVRRVDFLGSINQDAEDKDNHEARLYLDIYRDNAADKVVKVKQDLNRMRFVDLLDPLNRPDRSSAVLAELDKKSKAAAPQEKEAK